MQRYNNSHDHNKKLKTLSSTTQLRRLTNIIYSRNDTAQKVYAWQNNILNQALAALTVKYMYIYSSVKQHKIISVDCGVWAMVCCVATLVQCRHINSQLQKYGTIIYKLIYKCLSILKLQQQTSSCTRVTLYCYFIVSYCYYNYENALIRAILQQTCCRCTLHSHIENTSQMLVREYRERN